MEKSILIRYGEIFLKGKNKSYFERALISNIKKQLKQFQFNIYKVSGRFIINNFDLNYTDNILNELQKVFGIHSISLANCIKTDKNSIIEYVNSLDIYTKTFKVDVNRADKTFEVKSMDFARQLGGVVLSKNPTLKVNLSSPETTIYIDIRENGETFLFDSIINGLGGMPVGTSGKAMLLLSGGIDSPVAGFLMAKRGLSIDAIHYHSFPYTSELAKEKVINLAKLMTHYTGDINLHIVPFTKIQEEIHKNCNSEYMITIMRRFMMRIAEKVSQNTKCGALITGENLAQVASQTMESMTVTGGVVQELPIFRPLISSDKEEIVSIAKKINTFTTSILPYEDCCTVFLPENPVIKPKKDKVEKEEGYLDVEKLIDNAIENIEIIKITRE